MALKETSHKMSEMLHDMITDLEKSLQGNRAASQRARTRSIAFAKLAKVFRKESVAAEKKGGKKSFSKYKLAKKKAKKK